MKQNKCSRLDLRNNNTIRDRANNPLAGDFTSGEVYTIDTTVPTVTINQAAGQAAPVSSGPIHFTVVFNEPVTGFGPPTVAQSGTTRANSVVISELAPNNGTTYDVAFDEISRAGTIIATIRGGAGRDVINASLPSTSSDNSVTFVMGTAGAVNAASADAVTNTNPVSAVVEAPVVDTQTPPATLAPANDPNAYPANVSPADALQKLFLPIINQNALAGAALGGQHRARGAFIPANRPGRRWCRHRAHPQTIQTLSCAPLSR